MSRTEEKIRRELKQVFEEESALVPDDLAGRSRLRARRDKLTAELRALLEPGSEDQQLKWAERAATKPSREGKPYISSPGEGGGL